MEQTQLAQVATPLCQIEQRLTRTEQVGSASETFDAALLAGEVTIKWTTFYGSLPSTRTRSRAGRTARAASRSR